MGMCVIGAGGTVRSSGRAHEQHIDLRYVARRTGGKGLGAVKGQESIAKIIKREMGKNYQNMVSLLKCDCLRTGDKRRRRRILELERGLLPTPQLSVVGVGGTL